MNTILEIPAYTVISIAYNFFIHHLSTIIYRDMPFEEKYYKNITFLFIAGLTSIVLAKILFQKRILKNGITLGGIILILTSLVGNWENINDEIKLVISGASLLIILIYFNRKDKENKEKVVTSKKKST